MQMMAGGAIGGGVTSAVARALGAGEVDRAEGVAWRAVVVGAAFALIFLGVLGFYPNVVFGVLGGDGAALDGAITYAQVAFGGGGFLWLTFMLAAILRGTGDTKMPARPMFGASVVQIGLPGTLTLGWGHFPN